MEEKRNTTIPLKSADLTRVIIPPLKGPVVIDHNFVRETPSFPPEQETPLRSPSRVREVVGHVIATGKDVVQSDIRGIGNSTRWVFRVELSGDVTIQLLDFRSERPMLLNCLSLAMAPLSETFWDARPYFELDKGLIHIRKGAPTNTSPRLLVTIDALAPHELRGRGL